MAKIFRKFRFKVLREGRFANYLKYAIGEILLVVVGILIALQVNEWHKDRLDHREETIIKQNLNEEFTENQAILLTAKTGIKRSIQSTLTLINLSGASRSEIENQKLDSLFFFALEGGSFHPSENALQDVLQSGRMNLIADKLLRENLLLWTTTVKSESRTNDIAENWSTGHIITFLLPYASLRQWDEYGDNPGQGKTKLATDYFAVFQKLEFENLLDNYLYLLQLRMDELNKIEVIQKKIIDHTSV